MKYNPLTLLIATAVTCNAASTLVTPTSMTVGVGVSEFFPAVNLINDSGLSGAATFSNYTTITHSSAGAANAWTTNDPGAASGDFYAEGGTTPVFTFDLGSVQTLTDLVYWGYHFNIAGGNEAREYSLEFSTDGGSSYSAPTVVSATLGAYAIQNSATISLGGSFDANTVRMTITDNHFGGTANGGDRVGLGEIKFIAVPEPSSTALLGLGGLALVLRRRR